MSNEDISDISSKWTNEDILDLSSKSSSTRCRELKSLLYAGGCGGRMRETICDDIDFVNKTKEVDEKGYNIDDNIIINVSNLHKSISDAYCCKICTKIEIEKKFYDFIIYLEKRAKELLQTSLKQNFTSELMRYKWT